ncbi:MAG: serine/threonine-protein kinase [Polyangiaceae bacterium]|jgi:serine/threonine-protein kinase
MGEPAGTQPRIVGRYAMFDEIAAGGMATVYLGRLMGSGGFSRTVAIKRLHPQLAKDPEFVAMFLDEARLAARIRHPNVVPTLDVVASNGELFHVMEYVQGESLSHLARGLRARGERVPLPIVLRIMMDVLHGLHAAHEARDERGVPLGIVHRDVTPQNILVGVDGAARLLDFGVAKATGRAATTQEGQIKGKLAYMAPEQLMSAGVTRETDLYSASVVLWEMLVGDRLFTGESDLDVVAKLLQHNIRPPSRLVPDVPPALDAVVMRGLAAKMDNRFATAREMGQALATCGVPEAPSIAVGEWVEKLAAQSVADRLAKIAAIESVSDSDLVSSDALSPVLRAGAATRVDWSPGARPSAIPIAGAQAAAIDETTRVTASARIIPSASRVGLRIGGAAALVLVALGSVIAFGGIRERIGARIVSTRPAVQVAVAAPSITAPSDPAKASDAPLSVVGLSSPPAPQPPIVPGPPSTPSARMGGVSDGLHAPVAVGSPSAAPAAPERVRSVGAPRRGPPPGSRPAAPPPAKPDQSAAGVFDSRE